MTAPTNKLKKSQYVQYPPIEITEPDFTEIIFSDLEGYIIGTTEVPITDASIAINLEAAIPGTAVLMFHSSASQPTFNAGDSVNIFKSIGSYVTSSVNPISIIYIRASDIMIVYGNEASAVFDGIQVPGTINYDSAIQADYIGFEWRKNGSLNQSGSVLNQAVTGTPSNFDRIDILEGGSANDVYYKAGTESQDQPFPSITSGRILLATILRKTDGTNVIDISPEALSDFVSKTETGTQTIQSNLEIAPLAGTIRDSLYPNANGRISKLRVDYHGIYNTLSGSANWSRLIRVNATLNNQLDYSLGFTFQGVNSQKGMVWIEFTLDAPGNMVSNNLKLFGDFTASRFKMVKIASYIYDIFVEHTEANDFFKWRPDKSFGSSDKYTYYNQEALAVLPAGDQYNFSLFGTAGAGVGLSLDGSGNIQLGDAAEITYDVGSEFFVYLSDILRNASSDVFLSGTVSAAFMEASSFAEGSGGFQTQFDSSGSEVKTYFRSIANGSQQFDIIITEDFSTNIVSAYVKDDINNRGLGDFADYSANKTDFDYATKKMLTNGVQYSTLKGTIGWAKLAVLTSDTATQLKYSLILDASYIVSAEEYYYGNVVVYLELNVSDVLTYSITRINGNLDPADFKLVETAVGEFTLFFNQTQLTSELKFKTNLSKELSFFQFFNNEAIVVSLPVGTQYDFIIIDGGYLLKDGTIPLTANWDAGAFDIEQSSLTLKQLSLGTPQPGRFEFSGDRMYLTNVSTPRAIDRTSSVKISTTTVSNTVTETTVYNASLGANDLKIYNLIKVFASGVITNATASDDITINVYMGATLLETFTPAIGAVTNANWDAEFVATVRSVGVSGSIAFRGSVTIDGSSEIYTSIQTIDTTITENILVRVQWVNAKVGNTISSYQGWIEFKN